LRECRAGLLIDTSSRKRLIEIREEVKNQREKDTGG
jgi:hypothetical protein